MKNSDKKVAGVWLDHTVAFVITTENHLPSGEYRIAEKVKSHVHHHSGGSENSHQHMQQEERHKYYAEIAKHLQPFDELLFFGPGQAQEELFNGLTHNKQFAGKKLSMDTADKLTEHQMIAKVREFFVHHTLAV